LARERSDRASVETQLHIKTRQLSDLEAKFTAHINARYCCNEVGSSEVTRARLSKHKWDLNPVKNLLSHCC